MASAVTSSANIRLSHLLQYSASHPFEISRGTNHVLISSKRISGLRISIFPENDSFSWNECTITDERFLLEALPDALFAPFEKHLRHLDRTFRTIARAYTFYYPHHSACKKWDLSSCDTLLPSDAKFVNTSWKYGNAASLSIFQEAIENRQSSCIRESDGLKAWAVHRHDGSIGNVYTLEKERGRGLARKVVADLTAKVMKTQVPFCHIEPENEASIKLFESLGWKKIDEDLVHWIRVDQVRNTK